MKWVFHCPICNDWNQIEWAERDKKYVCTKDKSKTFIAPTPMVQRDGYVNERTWPTEIEEAVRNLKGTNCTVPGCQKRGDTLDHRIAWTNGGKTSVENLFPMCSDHNSSKGDKEYTAWLRENKLVK